jgi:hypothetical protein
VCDGDPFFSGLFFQFVIQIKTYFGEFGGGDGCAEGFAIEELVLEFDGDVGHDHAYSGEVKLFVAVMFQELDPDLVDDREDGVVTDMAAVVEVGDADRDSGGKVEVVWEKEFSSWHK